MVRNLELKAPARRPTRPTPSGPPTACPGSGPASRSRSRPPTCATRQVAHGYTKEELAMVLKPMADRRLRADLLDGRRLAAAAAGRPAPARSPTTCASASPR